MYEDVINAVSQYGPAGLIFVGFMLVLKWVIQTNNDVLKRADQNIKTAHEALQGFAENIKENTTSAKAFQDQVKLDHEASAREHRETAIILGRINGYH